MKPEIYEARKKFNEIIARYTLEPSLKDIYVEGSIDEIVIALYLDRNNLSNTKVYQISIIDFTEIYSINEDIKANRNQLLYLANLLNNNFDSNQLKVRCVIDKDFDEILEVSHNNFILTTDFASIEGYIIEQDLIKKILKVAFPNFPIDVNLLINEILKICLEAV